MASLTGALGVKERYLGEIRGMRDDYLQQRRELGRRARAQAGSHARAARDLRSLAMTPSQSSAASTATTNNQAAPKSLSFTHFDDTELQTPFGKLMSKKLKRNFAVIFSEYASSKHKRHMYGFCSFRYHILVILLLSVAEAGDDMHEKNNYYCYCSVCAVMLSARTM